MADFNAAKRTLVRLEMLNPQELPPHATLKQYQPASSDIDPVDFAKQIIQEGETFMKDYLSTAKTIDLKHCPPAKASVTLTSKTFKPTDLPPRRDGGKRETEAWFGRTSIHENKREEGTADWAEFEQVLFYDRNRNEQRYTPDILDAKEICNWDEELKGMEGEASMSVWEMYHKIPILTNRRFTVLAVTSCLPSLSPAFITVKLPVDDMPSLQTHKSAVQGRYISIERVELDAAVPTEEAPTKEGAKTNWDMVTASDAGGWLPGAMQRPKIPGEIAKDVGFVIGYIAQNRT